MNGGQSQRDRMTIAASRELIANIFPSRRNDFRDLPEPEDIPEPPHMTVSWAASEIVADFCRRSDKIIARLYGPRETAAHGFYNPGAFVDQSRRNSARTRIYRLLVSRLCEKAVRRGILTLDGTVLRVATNG